MLCITHLPQVAAFADRQFAIAKESDADAGHHRDAWCACVEGDERLAELCRMLGAAPDDDAARSHAESLLARARQAPERAGAARSATRDRRRGAPCGGRGPMVYLPT